MCVSLCVYVGLFRRGMASCRDVRVDRELVDGVGFVCARVCVFWGGWGAC